MLFDLVFQRQQAIQAAIQSGIVHLPLAMCKDRPMPWTDYQCCSRQTHCPESHSRLIANTAAKRDHGTSAISWSDVGKNSSNPNCFTTPPKDNSRRSARALRPEPSSPAPGLRWIIRSFWLRRKQLQLSALPVLVEDLTGLLPTRHRPNRSAQRDNRACAVADHSAVSKVSTSDQYPCSLPSLWMRIFSQEQQAICHACSRQQGGRFSLHPIFERALLKRQRLPNELPRNNSKWVAQ